MLQIYRKFPPDGQRVDKRHGRPHLTIIVTSLICQPSCPQVRGVLLESPGTVPREIQLRARGVLWGGCLCPTNTTRCMRCTSSAPYFSLSHARKVGSTELT